ncbi:HdeD family acid-resistance protein [Enterococcus sp. AZ126]|uniref:HdeD family acid-resistance protein n=1 Tax=Enterococcus sp. AZ126 TaxID=2774635 RepID=UPI003F26717D
MVKEKKFKIGYFIIGALFIWVSILAFQNPTQDLAALVIFFSIIAIVKGVVELVARDKMKEIEGIHSNWILVIGIIDLLVGIFFLLHLALGMVVSPFIFAIWFICDSVERVLHKDVAKQISNGYYYFSLIVNILGIIIGILLFLNPVVSALTIAFLVGFYLLLAGINYLIAAF